MKFRMDRIPSPVESGGYEAKMWSWCVREISPWASQIFNYDLVKSEFARLCREVKGMCYYEIRNGNVSIRGEPEPPRGGGDRRSMYLDFLRETVRLFCQNLSIDILIYLEDSGFDCDIPTFSFQKRLNQTCLLLPDVDFIRDRFFYPHDIFLDGTPFSAKLSRAVFAGSTSGYPVTEETIVNLLHPRVRSAVHFRGSDLVEFHIPSIVQYDSEKTKDILISMGFGNSPGVSWQTQFGRKFIISMDGNGATCSRLPITFRSNSILLKYESDSILYYFSGLTPWLHYIPIYNDKEVTTVVQAERRFPGQYEYITKSAQSFAKTFLTRYRAMQYAGWLLKSYASCVNPQPEGSPPSFHENNDDMSIEAIFGGLVAHIAERGDVWYRANSQIGEVGSGRAIQGFAIEPGVAFGLDEITYQTVRADGSLSDWCDGGVFCGTRGHSEPIYGFRIRLGGLGSEKYSVSYAGAFVGGASLGPVMGDEICRSPDGAPLEAMFIDFRSRRLC